MNFTDLQDKLSQLLQSHALLDLFELLDQHLARESDLQKLYQMLRNRYSRIRLDLAQGIMDRADENLEENQLVKGLIDLIAMMEEGDLRKAEKVWSLKSLCDEIEEKQALLHSSVDANSEQVIRIGESLIKLGKTLESQPPEGSGIDPLTYMKMGLKKGSRRMKIGYAEAEQTFQAILAAFQQIYQAYKNLVNYLDNPQEDLESEELTRVRTVSDALKRSITNMESTEFNQLDFQAVVAMADQILGMREQLGTTYEFLFTFMEEMKAKTLAFKDVLGNIEGELPGLIQGFQELFIELALNIHEQQEDISN